MMTGQGLADCCKPVMTGSDKRKPGLLTQKKFCFTLFRCAGQQAGTARGLYVDITRLISAGGEKKNTTQQLPLMCVCLKPPRLYSWDWAAIRRTLPGASCPIRQYRNQHATQVDG